MKKKLKIIVILGIYVFSAKAQIGINCTNPDSLSALEIRDNKRGILIPRSDGLKDKLINKELPEGLLYYDTGDSIFYFYDGQNWQGVNAWKASDLKNIESHGAVIINGKVMINGKIKSEKLETGDILALNINASSFSGNGAKVTHVNAETLDGHGPGYFAKREKTNKRITKLEEKFGDYETLELESTNKKLFEVVSQNLIYEQIYDFVYLTGYFECKIKTDMTRISLTIKNSNDRYWFKECHQIITVSLNNNDYSAKASIKKEGALTYFKISMDSFGADKTYRIYFSTILALRGYPN